MPAADAKGTADADAGASDKPDEAKDDQGCREGRASRQVRRVG